MIAELLKFEFQLQRSMFAAYSDKPLRPINFLEYSSNLERNFDISSKRNNERWVSSLDYCIEIALQQTKLFYRRAKNTRLQNHDPFELECNFLISLEEKFYIQLLSSIDYQRLNTRKKIFEYCLIDIQVNRKFLHIENTQIFGLSQQCYDVGRNYVLTLSKVMHECSCVGIHKEYQSTLFQPCNTLMIHCDINYSSIWVKYIAIQTPKIHVSDLPVFFSFLAFVRTTGLQYIPLCIYQPVLCLIFS